MALFKFNGTKKLFTLIHGDYKFLFHSLSTTVQQKWAKIHFFKLPYETNLGEGEFGGLFCLCHCTYT